MQSTIREARLKPDYASFYPGVEPGIWLPATVIGQQLLLWHLTAPATPQGERLMSEEHFEFRGGQKTGGLLDQHADPAGRRLKQQPYRRAPDGRGPAGTPQTAMTARSSGRMR